MDDRTRREDLDVGRWLAVSEPDDEHGPPKTVWRLRGRGSDEVQATWAGVLLCLECVYLDEVEDVLAAAKARRLDLSRLAVALGVPGAEEETDHG